MKVFCPFLLALLLMQSTCAQFAFVSDKDGYVNVRDSGNTRGKVVDTLTNGRLAYLITSEGNWANIFYTKKGRELDGYVYLSRLQPIDTYDSIPLKPGTDEENSITFGKDSITVIVTSQPFDPAKYRFTYDSYHAIIRINSKQYWGTDGERPKTEYKSIVILTGNRRTILPRSATDNLFEPTIYATVVHYDRQNDVFYISSWNSDGAGGYTVLWRIRKGVYVDREIAYGF